MVLHPTINTEGVESDSLLNGSHHENHPPSPRYPRCPASQATLGSQVPQPLSWLPHAGQALYQDQEISRSLENTDILILKNHLRRYPCRGKEMKKMRKKRKCKNVPSYAGCGGWDGVLESSCVPSYKCPLSSLRSVETRCTTKGSTLQPSEM